LGPLKVVINVHNDQADTTFISDNDEVRKALESGMSNLRDKMNESGIQLGQANVSTSQQQSQQEFQQAAQNRVFQHDKSQTNAELVESDPQAKVTVRVSDGLVDTFA
jgi:flagellar hook-length control protein FliK